MMGHPRSGARGVPPASRPGTGKGPGWRTPRRAAWALALALGCGATGGALGGATGCSRACGEDPPRATVRRAGNPDPGGGAGRPGPPSEGVDARPVSLAPRLPAPTAAQRAFDGRHRAALLTLVDGLAEARRRLDALARRGASEPAFRARWPEARRRHLERVGRLRARALAVDPLGTRSWAARVATRLVADLRSRLPDAVQASWAPKPSGALSTAQADFTLIWRRLRRYVKALKTETSKGSTP